MEAKLRANVMLSFWRHWTWADRMRELHEHYSQLDMPEFKLEDIGAPAFQVSSLFTTLAIWYGLLFTTCEAIRTIARVDLDRIAPEYRQVRGRLEPFRNAVFHVDPKWWSPKLFDLLKNVEDAGRIRRVHKAVGAWIQVEMERRFQ